METYGLIPAYTTVHEWLNWRYGQQPPAAPEIGAVGRSASDQLPEASRLVGRGMLGAEA